MDELLAEIERMPAGIEYTGLFTADQMRAHARRIALLAFEAAAQECKKHGANYCVGAIRALSARLGE
jgi:hypothetical protein